MEGKIKLGKNISGDVLFAAMKNSEYMKSRGYKILYAREPISRESEHKIIHDVEITTVRDGYPNYALCFYRPKDSDYVHIRIEPSQSIEEFDYWITWGDSDRILNDLANFVKEVRGELPKIKTKPKKGIKEGEKKMEEMTEQEILEVTVDKLKEAGDTDEVGQILNDLTEALPPGEIKDFCQKIRKIVEPAIEIIEKEDEERLKEALKSLRAARAMLKKDKYPKAIPQEIIKAARDYLGEAIMVCKFMKGLADIFE